MFLQTCLRPYFQERFPFNVSRIYLGIAHPFVPVAVGLCALVLPANINGGAHAES